MPIIFLSKLTSLVVDEDNNVSDLYHIKVDDLVLPLPVCNGHKGKVSGFHHLFTALKDPRCRLESIYLNRCLIHRQAEYFSCLGETLLENRTLKRFKVANTFPPLEAGEPAVEHTLPLLLGLRNNTSLTVLDLGSLENMTVNTTVFRVLSHCLSQNRTLRSLNLCRWKFELNLDQETEKCAKIFLSETMLEELILTECEVSFRGLTTVGNIIPDIPRLTIKLKQVELLNTSIKILSLDSLVITFNSVPRVLRGRDVLFILHFSSLQELDVSDKPALDRNQDQKERTITDEILIKFFKDIQNNFSSSLKVLKMTNWKLSLNNTAMTGAELRNIFTKLGKLATISLNNIYFIQSPSDPPQEPVLLKTMIKHLPQLSKISMINCELAKVHVQSIFKTLKHRVKAGNTNITLYTRMVTQDGLEELLLLLQDSKSVDYKYDGKNGTLEIYQINIESILMRMKSMKIPKVWSK